MSTSTEFSNPSVSFGAIYGYAAQKPVFHAAWISRRAIISYSHGSALISSLFLPTFCDFFLFARHLC